MGKKQFNTKTFITVVVFIVAIIPGTIASLLYFHSEQSSIIEQASAYEEEIIREMSSDFTEFADQLDKIQYEVTSQFVTMGMDKIDFVDLKEGEVVKIHTLENLLQSMKRTYSGINNIYVISRNDQEIVYGSTMQFNKKWLLENEWLDDRYTTSKEWSIIQNHPVSYHSSSVKNIYTADCFSFVVGLVNKDGDDEFEYILQVDIDAEHLYSLIYNIQIDEKDALAVYHQDGSLAEERNVTENAKAVLQQDILRTNFEEKENVIREEGGFLLARTWIPEAELFVYKISQPLDGIGVQHLYRQIMVLIMISLLVAAIAARAISSSFMKPFEELVQQTIVSFDHVSELPIVSIGSRSSLIQTMEEQFNVLIAQVNSLMQSTLKQEKEKRDLQMKMLQAQINPHFMYNTLNSIKWMALMRRQPEIAEAITALVDLLEYCCKDTHGMVPLEEELEFLKNYIQIQKMRNPDNDIEVLYEIEEEVKALKIIKFSLQPSVENAFVHAFPEKKPDARIVIKGYRRGERLILEVQDNGAGFDVEAVKRNMTGIGIENVDNRIKLSFGPEFGQKIDSHVGTGTTVTIEIPVLERESPVNGEV